MCTDTDTATNPDTETFILIGLCSGLCGSVRVRLTDGCVCYFRPFLCLFSPFFLASGKARVVQSFVWSAKSRRTKQRSS